MTIAHKAIIAVVICILGLVGFQYFMNRNGGQPEDWASRAAIPVEAAFVKTGDLVRQERIMGVLKAPQSVTLRPEVSGRIQEILFEEGQEVQKDDPLYKIEDGIYAAKVKEAKAQVDLARVEYDRAVTLLKKDFGTTQNRDKALAALHQSEARLQEAQLQLDHTTIRAPFGGSMGISNVSVGAFVSESVELVTIVDLDPMKIEFTIPEKFLGTFKGGDIVDVTVEGYDILPMEATIKAISPEVDLTTHSVTVVAEMKNPELALRPGQFARVLLKAGTAENAIIVPEAAVEREGDENYVMRIEEGVAVRTVVDTGYHTGSNVEIVNGLKPGDQVVVSGQFKLQDGTPVRVVDKDDEALKGEDENGQDAEPENTETESNSDQE